jgi:biopolymer transport protein ExbD
MAGGAQSEDDGMVSGINVTPLVDVCLVLLVILMVTAKFIAQSSLTMDLPKAAKPDSTPQLVFGLEVHANGDIVVDGKKLDGDKSLVDAAKKGLEKNKDLRALIRADRTVQHGKIIHILDVLKGAGVSKIAFGVTPIAVENDKDSGKEAPKPATP